MHVRYPAHIVFPYLHLHRLRNVVAGACVLMCGLTIQPHIEMTVEAIPSYGIAPLRYHLLSIAGACKESIHPAHDWTRIIPHR